MVNTFGFRPGGPYGMLAPFGFGPPGRQGAATLAGGYGQDGDVADIIPVGGLPGSKKAPRLFCQNITCGAPTSELYHPLCPTCVSKYSSGYGPIWLENGAILKGPIEPGEEAEDWIGKRFRPPR